MKGLRRKSEAMDSQVPVFTYRPLILSRQGRGDSRPTPHVPSEMSLTNRPYPPVAQDNDGPYVTRRIPMQGRCDTVPVGYAR